MNSLIRAALTAFLISVSIPAQATEEKIIKIATEGAFPPWNAIDNSGRPIGFDIDVGNALCEKAGLKCEFITQAWDGIIPGLTVGKYDAIMAGMSITDKRRRVIAFSRPYATTANYFVVRKDIGLSAFSSVQRIDLTSMSEPDVLTILKNQLKGRTIGVQGATNAEVFMNEYFGKDVVIRVYDKQDNINLDIVAGRLDGGLADMPVWQAFLKDQSSIVEPYGPQILGGVFGEGVGIGFRQDEKGLAKEFNSAIEALAADGTLRKISLKWFNADIAPPTP